MAKIAKVRIINFVYNENRHIYDQTFDFGKGEDALLNLENGGGKTVMVQMMMQPVVPKLKLKNRKLKGYFKNTKSPCYIMIEWILDGQSKRVMTGIGIKKVFSQNAEENNERLKVVTFISEYEHASGFDISNIELLEEKKGIVRMLEFEKVIKKLSDAEKEGEPVWIYRWELPDDKREYNRRLLSYQIHVDEWKNLMVKINESEAGLNSFFNDCKTSGALIKKWFLPTIEDQLNQGGNVIENIRELIKNHASLRVKNEGMVKEREVFEDFRTASGKLADELKKQSDYLEQSRTCKEQLGDAAEAVHEKLAALGRSHEELRISREQTQAKLDHLEYEKLSGDYHKVSQELEQIRNNKNELSEKLGGLEQKISQSRHQIHVMQALSGREEIRELDSRISGFETELEKENLKQEDQRELVSDLSYSLKEIYREQEIRLKDRRSKEAGLLQEIKDRKIRTREDIQTAREQLNQAQKEKIILLTNINAYKEREKELVASYPEMNEYLSRKDETQLLDAKTVRDSLEKEEKVQHDRREKLENQALSIRQKQDELNRKLRECIGQRENLATEDNRAKNNRDSFEEKKQEVQRVLASIQRGESTLFERDRNLEILHAEAERYSGLIQELTLDNSILKKQRSQYESDSIEELPAEIAKTLEEHGIYVEHGYEWLKNASMDRYGKTKLLKKNPFLAAAVIVSKKDMEQIREMEFDGSLPSYIPLLERETLDHIAAEKSGRNVYTLGNLQFLVTYDDRLINKNFVKELSDEITHKIGRNEEALSSARQSLRHTELDILTVDQFTYTKAEADRIVSECERMKDQIHSNEQKILSLNSKLEEWGNRLSENKNDIQRLEKQQEAFSRKRREVCSLLDRIPGIVKALEKNRELDRTEENSQVQIRGLEEDTERVSTELYEQEDLLRSLDNRLEYNRKQYLKYQNVKSGKRIPGEAENLEAKLKALTFKSNGKIQNLREILEDYRNRRDTRKKELEKLHIPENECEGRTYSSSRHEEYIQTCRELEEDQDQQKDRMDALGIEFAEKNSDVKYALKMISDRCGQEQPIPKEEIRHTNFASDKKELLAVLHRYDLQMMNLKKQSKDLDQMLFTLEEFKEFSGGHRDDFVVLDDLRTWVRERLKEEKNTAKEIGGQKDILSAVYRKLETGFSGKNEMFKALFGSILAGEKRYQPDLALHALERVSMQIDRKIAQNSIDLNKMDDMEKGIVDNTISYLKNVYDEMNSIDKNSVIDVEGRRCKMLIMELPPKDSLDTTALREYLKATIGKCETLFRQEKSAENLLMNEINTFALFDRFAGINNIRIHMIKIEPNRLRKKSWRQVIEENSGGERFVSAFVVFISLLSYMRGEAALQDEEQSKVLIMDNSFGPITSEHLLKPLFEISKKYHTQMICLSDLKQHTIYDRFNLIYSLTIEREVGREEEYLEQKTIKRDLPEDENEDEKMSAALFQIEDLSRFEKVN